MYYIYIYVVLMDMIYIYIIYIYSYRPDQHEPATVGVTQWQVQPYELPRHPATLQRRDNSPFSLSTPSACVDHLLCYPPSNRHGSGQLPTVQERSAVFLKGSAQRVPCSPCPPRRLNRIRGVLTDPWSFDEARGEKATWRGGNIINLMSACIAARVDERIN